MKYHHSAIQKFLTMAIALSSGLMYSQAIRADAYDPPSTYYSSAEGLTGNALKLQLRTIMNNGFTRISYGDVRYAFAETDKDPNNPNNILLIYNRASVPSTWDNGATYDREHQWPQSLLGLNVSNSSKNAGSDLFMLRPSNPSINGSRSNNPFGTKTSSGTYGYKTSGYFYPGDADAGDVARAMFYAATTYSNLTLVNGQPGTYEMGDLASLIKWHYQDTPDTFERNRNQVIYSSYQHNRNAYIDHPEYVWSVFVDQQNDSRITVSTTDVNLGKVFVNGALGTQTVTINKEGMDGTYYSVTTSGNATSTVTGRYNAFEVDKTGSKQTTVGLNTSTSTAGLKSGTITVDNLDITTEGGAGRGANDEDDVINVHAIVVDHAKASLVAGSQQTILDINFGELTQGTGLQSETFTLFNLIQTADYTAMLDLDSFTFVGDQSAFSDNLITTKDIVAGTGESFLIFLDTTSAGDFSGYFLLNCSDEDLTGALNYQLRINVFGSVAAVPEPGTCLLLAIAGAGLLFRRRG